MKKIKILLFLLIVCFLSLIVYQNLAFFLTKHTLSFGMKIIPFGMKLVNFSYQSPEISMAMLLFGCFIIGLVLAYFSLLKSIFKSKKSIKDLNKTISENQKEISELKSKQDVSMEPATPKVQEATE